MLTSTLNAAASKNANSNERLKLIWLASARLEFRPVPLVTPTKYCRAPSNSTECESAGGSPVWRQIREVTKFRYDSKKQSTELTHSQHNQKSKSEYFIWISVETTAECCEIW